MYAVKVLHGYINENGQRTRDKRSAKVFVNKNYAKAFADRRTNQRNRKLKKQLMKGFDSKVSN